MVFVGGLGFCWRLGRSLRSLPPMILKSVVQFCLALDVRFAHWLGNIVFLIEYCWFDLHQPAVCHQRLTFLHLLLMDREGNDL
tara:strand:- start:64179 stop:64427 length:249 start_codon:yes stop_codon:yes gene_type:complete